MRIYRAESKLEVAKVKTVFSGTQKQDLVIDYDKVVFEINNVLAYALYPCLMETGKAEQVHRMIEFFLQIAKTEYDAFERWLKNPTK